MPPSQMKMRRSVLPRRAARAVPGAAAAKRRAQELATMHTKLQMGVTTESQDTEKDHQAPGFGFFVFSLCPL